MQGVGWALVEWREGGGKRMRGEVWCADVTRASVVSGAAEQ